MTIDDTVNDRVDSWTVRTGAPVRDLAPLQILLNAVHTSVRHRITGLAAEMAFFASLALIPFTVAFGGVLGYIEPWAGLGGMVQADRVVTEAMTIVFGPFVTDVASPYVRAQLEQARGGLAIGGFVAGMWLAGRVFLPAVLALDLAYGAVERRTVVRRRLIAVAIAVASLVVITIQVLLLIFGPLLGGARRLAEHFGQDATFTVLWDVFRWPVLAVALAAYLLAIYRYVPARRIGWRRSIPGAAVAVLAWLVASAALRAYLETGINPGQGIELASEAMSSVGRALGALVATVLWVFLSSVAVLFGGEINAAVERHHARRGRRDGAGRTEPTSA